jgi:hypothetical protein
LGALRVSAAALPQFNDVSFSINNNNSLLIVPVSGYKNNLYGDSHMIPICEFAKKALCPVTTFKWWKNQMTSPRLPHCFQA